MSPIVDGRKLSYCMTAAAVKVRICFVSRSFWAGASVRQILTPSFSSELARDTLSEQIVASKMACNYNGQKEDPSFGTQDMHLELLFGLSLYVQPDWPIHTLRASKSGDRRALCSSETSIDVFQGSQIVKRSIWKSQADRKSGLLIAHFTYSNDQSSNLWRPYFQGWPRHLRVIHLLIDTKKKPVQTRIKVTEVYWLFCNNAVKDIWNYNKYFSEENSAKQASSMSWKDNIEKKLTWDISSWRQEGFYFLLSP